MFHSSFYDDSRIDQSKREDFVFRQTKKGREKNSCYRIKVDNIQRAENKAESERTLTGFVGI